MSDAFEDLVEVEPLTHTEDGVVEIFRSVVTNNDVFDDEDADKVNVSTTKDSDGSGLILFIYKGRREWVKAAVSKIPFSYLKKFVEGDPAEHKNLSHILLVRGATDYPLTEKETKTLAARLNQYLAGKRTHVITSYATVYKNAPESETVIENALKDIIELMTVLGVDLSVTAEEPEPRTIEELRSGTEVLQVNGLTVTISTKLVEENEPEQGIDTVTVSVANDEERTLLSTSSRFRSV